MQVWELVVIILGCICCSAGVGWLFVDMHRQLKLWDEQMKNKEENK